MDRLPRAPGVWGFFGARERPRGPGWFFGVVKQHDESSDPPYLVEWQNYGRKVLQWVSFQGNEDTLRFQETTPDEVPAGVPDEGSSMLIEVLTHPERSRQMAVAARLWAPFNRERLVEMQRCVASIAQGRLEQQRRRSPSPPSRSASPPPRGRAASPPPSMMLMPDGERSLSCSLEQEAAFLAEGLTPRDVYVAARALFAEKERKPDFIAYAGRFCDTVVGRLCARAFTGGPRRSSSWMHGRLHLAMHDFISKHFGERFMDTSVQLREFEDMPALAAVNPRFAEWIQGHAEDEERMRCEHVDEGI